MQSSATQHSNYEQFLGKSISVSGLTVLAASDSFADPLEYLIMTVKWLVAIPGGKCNTLASSKHSICTDPKYINPP